MLHGSDIKMFPFNKILCLCFPYWKSTCVKIQDFFGVLNFFDFFLSFFLQDILILSPTQRSIWKHTFGSAFSRETSLSDQVPWLPMSYVFGLCSLVFCSCLLTCWWRYQMGSPFNCTAETQYRKFEQIFPKKGLCGHSPNFHILVSVSHLNIPRSICLFCRRKIRGRILGIYKLQNWHRHMNVEIGPEAAQFKEREHINGIFVAVWARPFLVFFIPFLLN